VTPVTGDDIHAHADGQLDPGRRAEVDAYLSDHPDAAAEVHSLEALNARLRDYYDPQLNEPVPERLKRIPRKSPGRWSRMAIAAGVFVVGVGAGWLVRGLYITPPQNYSLPRQAAVAHVVYSPEVRHPVEVDAKEEEHLVRWLSKRLGTDLKAPKLSEFGYELVGGRLLSGPNGPVAHFMFQDSRGTRLTLYVSRQREPRETAFRFSQEDRVSVFYWIDGKNGYALSGEVGREQLLRIANGVYQQLNP
jgi:anti-sigma factor RsiW